ncbi:uncharacterized protein K460DRAFT_417804 [Cucurbitaria berberidis CBS 394.84]|uniref:Uncharacterized protein n=1 Tax=Cucurbitaria berberidis CBS 394.84 TaxID=1168544 RepID=A0A9P4L983_9PLEO|nr:uncharacterized protein K460DRAFT_417804 [Cucurbitaria berberidis CBS 394.84]KAF1846785.1 hypothetical protein K460DRAFT_417804 [Cucurbitaria berberidis CBS 394.84]
MPVLHHSTVDNILQTGIHYCLVSNSFICNSHFSSNSILCVIAAACLSGRKIGCHLQDSKWSDISLKLKQLFFAIVHTDLPIHQWGATTTCMPGAHICCSRGSQFGFTFSQPFFIGTFLDYLTPALDPNAGYGLIGASFLIYSSIATSIALTCNYNNRLRLTVRSILVPWVPIRTDMACIEAADNNAELTLMSTDLECIRTGFRTLYELWASLIQVALAT